MNPVPLIPGGDDPLRKLDELEAKARGAAADSDWSKESMYYLFRDSPTQEEKEFILTVSPKAVLALCACIRELAADSRAFEGLYHNESDCSGRDIRQYSADAIIAKYLGGGE